MKSRQILLALAFVTLSLAFSGCVLRSYSEGSSKYVSFSFGTTQGVAPFVIEAGKKDSDSYRRLESKGLTNDPSSAAIEAAVSGAVKAAISSK